MSGNKSKITTVITRFLQGIDRADFTPQLKELDKELETIYDTYGFTQYRKMILQVLYSLLVNQGSIYHAQRWETPGLARVLAHMSCMRHFYLRDNLWPRIRTDLEAALDRAYDGEMRLASEADFLDELGNELAAAKTNFYESCRLRCAVFKQELWANVMHPDRIEKILSEHGMEKLEELFGC